MSNNQYNNKKLAPFKKQRDTLKEELKKLQQEQADEEKMNDLYFDEIGRVEKEYESLIKSIEAYNKHNHTLHAVGQTDQNQGLDETIEKNVTETLNLFLLNTSKKEYLESIQEQEISKKQSQVGNLTMTQKQINEEKQIVQEDEKVIFDDGYLVSLKQGQNSLVVKVPGTVRTFRELKQIVKSCFMAEEQEIFYTDLMGNVLQPDMNILDQLYPSIYELLKNYQPVIGIQIIKQKKTKEDTKKTEADFGFDGGIQELMTKQLRTVKRIEKTINWSQYMDYLTNFKYFLESILFVSLLILYTIVEINELDFFTNSQLLLNLNTNMAIQKSYISPIANISQIISLSIPNATANGLSSTYPLQSGLLIQTLVGIDDINNCNILNENQKQIYIDKKQSCLMFDIQFLHQKFDKKGLIQIIDKFNYYTKKQIHQKIQFIKQSGSRFSQIRYLTNFIKRIYIKIYQSNLFIISIKIVHFIYIPFGKIFSEDTITQTSDLQNSYTKIHFDPKVYNEQLGGYVWEFNLTSRESFQESYDLMIQEEWLQFNVKQSQFLLNYYNSPTQRIIQVMITTLHLFNDRLLNYNSFQAEGFNLSEVPEQVLINKNIIFYCSIVLLISSFFGRKKNQIKIDFFGLYFVGTQNNLIVIYLQYVELMNRKKKMMAKKRQLSESDQREIQYRQINDNIKLIVGEYAIINLKVVYITIRIPLVFDYIYILCQFGMVMKNSVDSYYEEALKEIDLKSDQYQDTSALIVPLFLGRIFSGILVLFLMISIVRFMGNWSPYLKCYGLVMIRFNKESWFLLLVLIFIISVCAMSWIVTIQGKLINHDNFFFTFLGLLRCTLRFGLDNDIEQQGFYNTYAKDLIYSFETKYVKRFVQNKVDLQKLLCFFSQRIEILLNIQKNINQ